ncbi:Protein argonaute 4B [Morella rubra]|uniref:Protein argonaute 4B n=1 Tax=Morella rubra TaxID=262757 RepID=A0A6A1WN61_9ROSI|nr:Protein argonaute 4B [Morella rubra]
MIIQPGPVVDFLIANQNVRDPFSLDWSKLCSLVSLQRYTKALSTLQRSSLVEKSRQKPNERMKILSDALKSNNCGSEPMLRSCGISINTNFTQVEGRVLPAPRLKVGNGEDFFPRNGRWNFNSLIGSRYILRFLHKDVKFNSLIGLDFLIANQTAINLILSVY